MSALTKAAKRMVPAAKASYLVRSAGMNADECDVVIDVSATKAARQWRKAHPQAAGRRVMVWYWSQNEFSDRPGYVSFPEEGQDER